MQIEERTSTGTLFGAGTVAIVRHRDRLSANPASREHLLRSIDQIAPGNAIAFVDLIASGGKGPAQAGVLRDAIVARRGRVEEFPAPSRERMEGWIANRAKQLDATLGPGAAHLLAERIGAYVREGDVDRRRQTELANAELEKLALYRPDSPITTRRCRGPCGRSSPRIDLGFPRCRRRAPPTDASALISRLLAEATPMPVMISQIHRRVRDLIVIREHIDAGTSRPTSCASEAPAVPGAEADRTGADLERLELDDALERSLRARPAEQGHRRGRQPALAVRRRFGAGAHRLAGRALDTSVT